MLFPSGKLTGDVQNLIYHYASGRFPNWLNGANGEVGWYKPSHRGVQLLDKIVIPSGQKRYIITDRFEFKWNAAYRQVIDACADPSREGKTWITPELIEGYCNLQNAGYAFSAEAWQDGKLAGGLFGVHIGGFLTVESMFHHINHSSKFAYGQLLLRAKERGFALVDVNFVQPHFERFGAEWMPQWKFEEMLRGIVRQTRSLADGMPAPALSKKLMLFQKAERAIKALRKRWPGLRAQACAADTSVGDSGYASTSTESRKADSVNAAG